MAKTKKLLYVQTRSIDTPRRLYSPFMLARTAKAMNLEPTIYFLGEELR
jgi:predicted peroxiredoxin